MRHSDPRPPAILVLAQGQADRVSENTKIRICRALAYVKEVWKAARTFDSFRAYARPQLIFAAGVGSVESSLTLAERMACFAAGERDRMRLPETRFDIICNGKDTTIWGTSDEVKWGYEHAKASGTPRLVIVTNERHAKRVKRISRSFEIEEVEIVLSDDPPPSRIHELLARGMETTEALGLKRWVQPLRRKYYAGD